MIDERQREARLQPKVVADNDIVKRQRESESESNYTQKMITQRSGNVDS